ncbi:iron-sulfur cluster repair di-iron protein [Hoeflea sp. G2-23]|uniref:Iron-sulfur cluster repair di-iron protein n=1 Tax=Hoeflea algicola TaxID=2983763 RepID=A0ABT3Z7N5_9HYPH|nr:iron-sulfur cluster repair di-iron protein [Hoeflea algicola]MCY0147791.1 iron-sulfur cluster repair di-iron protein [Hoeflea algicola]
MTTAALNDRNVGEIAAQLPGATSVFRRFGIDFCCHGDISLTQAAAERGLDIAELETALQALDPKAAPEAPQETDALISHIQTRYHDVHRQQIPELIELSRKVEAVHAGHANAPEGLADVLQQIMAELETHMHKEEQEIFPAMRRKAADPLATPISELRHDHDAHGVFLEQVGKITDDYTLPGDACRSWEALYAGAAQLKEDLMEHIHLENNVLFPRFETGATA